MKRRKLREVVKEMEKDIRKENRTKKQMENGKLAERRKNVVVSKSTNGTEKFGDTRVKAIIFKLRLYV